MIICTPKCLDVSSLIQIRLLALSYPSMIHEPTP